MIIVRIDLVLGLTIRVDLIEDVESVLNNEREFFFNRILTGENYILQKSINRTISHG